MDRAFVKAGLSRTHTLGPMTDFIDFLSLNPTGAAHPGVPKPLLSESYLFSSLQELCELGAIIIIPMLQTGKPRLQKKIGSLAQVPLVFGARVRIQTPV